MSTKIEWTNFLPGYKGESWNPIIGCSKTSPGCDNCYAEKMAGRLAHIALNKSGTPTALDYYADATKNNHSVWNGKTYLVKEALDKPFKWKKPRVVFVCSMGDLFHESVSYDDILKVLVRIEKSPQHIFIVLTKRPHIMADMMQRFYSVCSTTITKEHLPNLWLGTTTENQEQVEKRIPILLKIPAAVRFVSVEPMLGSINLKHIDAEIGGHDEFCIINSLNGKHTDMGRLCEGVNKLDWVICGGESGPNARPMHTDWVRSLRDQCKTAGTPFFFKQWGEFMSFQEATCDHTIPLHGKIVHMESSLKGNDDLPGKVEMIKVGKKKAGRLLDGKEWNEYPLRLRSATGADIERSRDAAKSKTQICYKSNEPCKYGCEGLCRDSY